MRVKLAQKIKYLRLARITTTTLHLRVRELCRFSLINFWERGTVFDNRDLLKKNNLLNILLWLNKTYFKTVEKLVEIVLLYFERSVVGFLVNEWKMKLIYGRGHLATCEKESFLP